MPGSRPTDRDSGNQTPPALLRAGGRKCSVPSSPSSVCAGGVRGLEEFGDTQGLGVRKLGQSRASRELPHWAFHSPGFSEAPSLPGLAGRRLGRSGETRRAGPRKMPTCSRPPAPESPALPAPAAPGSWWQVGDGRMHPPPGQPTCTPPGPSAVGRAKLTHRSPEDPPAAVGLVLLRLPFKAGGGWAALGRAPWCLSCLPPREFSPSPPLPGHYLIQS